MFNILETVTVSKEINYFNLWQVAGAILGDVPSQYEFLQVFVCVALVFMMCMIMYSPILIIKTWLERKR